MVTLSAIEEFTLRQRIRRAEDATLATDEFVARGALLVAALLWGRGELGAAERMVVRAERALGWRP